MLEDGNTDGVWLSLTPQNLKHFGQHNAAGRGGNESGLGRAV